MRSFFARVFTMSMPLLLVLAACSSAADQTSDKLPWRDRKVGAFKVEKNCLGDVTTELALRASTPIHVITVIRKDLDGRYDGSNCDHVSLDLRDGATLGQAVDSLLAQVPGLTATPTEKGVLMTCRFPDEVMAHLNARLNDVEFKGNSWDFMERFVIPYFASYSEPGWAEGALTSELTQVRVSEKGPIRLIDMLVKVAENRQWCLRMGMTPEMVNNRANTGPKRLIGAGYYLFDPEPLMKISRIER
jgi:hypothetical protein